MAFKHMLLLSFLLLCLLSALTQGRRLGAEIESRGREGKVEPQFGKVKQQVQEVEEHDLGEGGDEVLVGMDYTPASRKSPVHN
uniref:Uncharacterized protein n=1 Tax=Kalanchoe fedtschenkoi TaxID=63787 RepID=A0A7N0TS37_KALFE